MINELQENQFNFINILIDKLLQLAFFLIFGTGPAWLSNYLADRSKFTTIFFIIYEKYIYSYDHAFFNLRRIFQTAIIKGAKQEEFEVSPIFYIYI